jgi:vacuolar-type H+-ATPase subunit D/Vma8
MLDAVSKCLEKSRSLYQPMFEIQDKYDPAEQEYERLLQDIQERLDDITAISGIIDKAKVDDGDPEATFG